MYGDQISSGGLSGRTTHDQARRKQRFLALFQLASSLNQLEQRLDRMIGHGLIVMGRSGKGWAGEAGIGMIIMRCHTDGTILVTANTDSQFMAG